MKQKIFVLNGNATCGKDTFAQMVGNYVKTSHFSIVDPIRKIMSNLPKEVEIELGKKDERLRLLTSDLKLALERFSDYPYREVKNFIAGEGKNKECIFIDMREKHNIEQLKKDYDAKVIFIENNRAPRITSNVADAHIFENPYDIKIENNGTLEDLEREAKYFVEKNVLI